MIKDNNCLTIYKINETFDGVFFDLESTLLSVLVNFDKNEQISTNPIIL